MCTECSEAMARSSCQNSFSSEIEVSWNRRSRFASVLWYAAFQLQRTGKAKKKTVGRTRNGWSNRDLMLRSY